MVLTRPDEKETCPYHCCLHLFTMVRGSTCGPITCWILTWTLFVTWTFQEMHSILQKHLISMACILLWSSAVSVHDSQAYRIIQNSESSKTIKQKRLCTTPKPQLTQCEKFYPTTFLTLCAVNFETYDYAEVRGGSVTTSSLKISPPKQCLKKKATFKAHTYVNVRIHGT